MIAGIKRGLAFCLAVLPLYLLIFHDFTPQHDTSSEPLFVTKASSKAALAKVVDLWSNHEYSAANRALAEINPLDQPLVSLYQPYIDDYLGNRKNHRWEQQGAYPPSCKQKLLFVTGELESLHQANQFKQRLSDDKRLGTLPICVHQVTFFDPDTVLCQSNWLKRGRLGCDLLSFAKQLKNIDFTHLVIFADEGKANVHNGIMFLDKQDTYDVFVHELAHFSGFIDEYPLSAGLAKRVCAGVDAPNLIFKNAAEKANPSTEYLARTCDNHAAQAFKASSQLTFMEYHDLAYIPQHYLSAWKTLLNNLPKHPSAHLNFAQLYEEANNQNDSQFWRKEYQSYLAGI
ncbi:hypothetical protein [Paraglaciecola marina]|uniref:hypothetical protein n=1 Tax=Paraglaciecola marina TaxID=2500157 RepID=UPI001061133E|nr:hypothetical protein [Paraglaciecola marina]